MLACYWGMSGGPILIGYANLIFKGRECKGFRLCECRESLHYQRSSDGQCGRCEVHLGVLLQRHSRVLFLSWVWRYPNILGVNVVCGERGDEVEKMVAISGK